MLSEENICLFGTTNMNLMNSLKWRDIQEDNHHQMSFTSCPFINVANLWILFVNNKMCLFANSNSCDH